MNGPEKAIILPPGYSLEFFETTDSTNANARRAATGGFGGDGVGVFWAESQTAGRGRAGREWVSERGNLYFSLLLVPGVAVGRVAELGFVMAVAVARSLKAIPGSDFTVAAKWPNDILLNGKKICGMLLECDTNPGTDADPWVIIGIGINISSHPRLAGAPIGATSLAAEGVKTNPGEMLSRVIGAFADEYGAWHRGGFGPVRENWLAIAHGLGERVTVKTPGFEESGIFENLDRDGHMILRMDGGGEKIISAGDVFFGTGGK